MRFSPGHKTAKTGKKKPRGVKKAKTGCNLVEQMKFED